MKVKKKKKKEKNSTSLVLYRSEAHVLMLKIAHGSGGVDRAGYETTPLSICSHKGRGCEREASKRGDEVRVLGEVKRSVVRDTATLPTP